MKEWRLLHSTMIKTQRCTLVYDKITLDFDKSPTKIQALLAQKCTPLRQMTRDLQNANGFYKRAIDAGCREAAYEYGEFLVRVADTLPRSDSRYDEFYGHAVDAYENAGYHGLVMGFIKAVETLKTMSHAGTLENDLRIQRLLRAASIIALDGAVVECCARMSMMTAETCAAIGNEHKKTQDFLIPKIRQFLSPAPRLGGN